MAIELKCPACGKGIKAPEKLAGRSARCPGCRRNVGIPTSPAAPPAEPFPGFDEFFDETQRESAVIEPPPRLPAVDESIDDVEGEPAGLELSPPLAPAPSIESVVIRDVQLPFRTVYRLAWQVFLANMLIGLWVGAAILAVFLLISVITRN
jgi:hypothetical protein